jgi:hypothetical protein
MAFKKRGGALWKINLDALPNPRLLIMRQLIRDRGPKW